MTAGQLCNSCVLVTLVSAGCITHAPTRDPFATSVAGHVEALLAKSPIAGISIAIGRGNSVAYARGFGLADIESRRPLGSGAVMDIGSIGKQFTAAAVLKLVDAGRVDLDAPVSRYLPGWIDGGRGTTVRQLLTHTSGLDDPPFSEENPEPRFLAPITSAAFLTHMLTAPFRTAPEHTWYYANAGYQILGLMLEQMHGMPYGRIIEEVIGQPLALRGLYHCDKSRAIPSRASDYMIRDGRPVPIPPVDVSWFGGAGSLCASASDLIQWEQALWQGRVVSKRSLDAMHAPVTIRDGDPRAQVDYGLGRAFGMQGGHRKIGHPGVGAGITAMLSHYPDDDLILAVLVNSNGVGVPEAREIEARLAANILGLDPPPAQTDAPLSVDQVAAGPVSSLAATDRWRSR